MKARHVPPFHFNDFASTKFEEKDLQKNDLIREWLVEVRSKEGFNLTEGDDIKVSVRYRDSIKKELSAVWEACRNELFVGLPAKFDLEVSSPKGHLGKAIIDMGKAYEKNSW